MIFQNIAFFCIFDQINAAFMRIRYLFYVLLNLANSAENPQTFGNYGWLRKWGKSHVMYSSLYSYCLTFMSVFCHTFVPVLKVQVKSKERSGPWWQFSILVQSVFSYGLFACKARHSGPLGSRSGPELWLPCTSDGPDIPPDWSGGKQPELGPRGEAISRRPHHNGFAVEGTLELQIKRLPWAGHPGKVPTGKYHYAETLSPKLVRRIHPPTS